MANRACVLTMGGLPVFKFPGSISLCTSLYQSTAVAKSFLSFKMSKMCEVSLLASVFVVFLPLISLSLGNVLELTPSDFDEASLTLFHFVVIVLCLFKEFLSVT